MIIILRTILILLNNNNIYNNYSKINIFCTLELYSKNLFTKNIDCLPLAVGKNISWLAFLFIRPNTKMTSLQSTPILRPKKHNIFCWKQNLNVYYLKSTTWETVSFNILFVTSKLHISSTNTQFFIENHHSIEFPYEIYIELENMYYCLYPKCLTLRLV